MENVTSQWKYWTLIVTYSFAAIVIDLILERIVSSIADYENHRYQIQHDNQRILYLFGYNIIVYYLPLIFTTFDVNNKNRFKDLASLMFT